MFYYVDLRDGFTLKWTWKYNKLSNIHNLSRPSLINLHKRISVPLFFDTALRAVLYCNGSEFLKEMEISVGSYAWYAGCIHALSMLKEGKKN